jgi:hypothetical protein
MSRKMVKQNHLSRKATTEKENATGSRNRR